MKNIIIGIIIGGIVFTLGGVIATTAISSTNVTYQNKTVNTALDELYNEAITGKELVAAAITNKGVKTTSNDTYETMATNINSIDTDHTEINQKISSLESQHTSDVASLKGSISNLNQNVASFKKVRSLVPMTKCSTTEIVNFKSPMTDGGLLIFIFSLNGKVILDTQSIKVGQLRDGYSTLRCYYNDLVNLYYVDFKYSSNTSILIQPNDKAISNNFYVEVYQILD